MKKTTISKKEVETTKYCKGCSQTLPLSSFHGNGDSAVMPNCGTCRQKARGEENHPRKEGMKYCPKCGKDLPTSEFDSDKSQPDGLQSMCKASKREIQLKRLSTYEGFTSNLLKNLRGNEKKKGNDVKLTADDVKKLYTKQKGKCAITGEQMTHVASDRDSDKQSATNKSNISIKRIDKLKAYTPDNIQLVCSGVSKSKK